jgi:hypothetical protein
MCVWKWQAIDSEEMKDFDGLLSFLYGFLVLCSSSFCFMQFVESYSAVFFKAISQLPSLTVSEFYFFVQLGRPPFIWVQICREVGLWVWLVFVEHRLCLVVFLFLFFWFLCCFRLDFFDWFRGWCCCHGPADPGSDA